MEINGEYDDGFFQWNLLKATSNRRKHGVSFSEAKTVFGHLPALSFPDELEEELRWITIGRSAEGRMLFVVSTDRGPKIRIISARPANNREIARYVAGE